MLLTADGFVALYFIAAGVLVYICTRSRSTVLKPGLQQRALAARGGEGEDSEDQALDSILSECLAMAEESGTVLTAFAPPAEDAEEAARRKASLEQYLRTDSPGIEAPQTSQQPTSHFLSSPDEPLPYSRRLMERHQLIQKGKVLSNAPCGNLGA
ncbi:hypothetical protein Efla_004515 [Eimeria flavescens]